MFKIEKEEGKNVLVAVEGKLDSEDYKKFVPDMEELIKKYNKINCVADLSELDSATPAALLEEVKLSHKYRDNIGRYAIVDPKPWLENIVEIATALSNAEVKTFPKGERQKAWDWIQGK